MFFALLLFLAELSFGQSFTTLLQGAGDTMISMATCQAVKVMSGSLSAGYHPNYGVNVYGELKHSRNESC
jgi:hypothetical protein